MIDKEQMRAGLLSSLGDGIALLQKVQSGVREMSDFNVADSTKLQMELAKHNSAVTERYLRMKKLPNSVDAAEPRSPDWDHWVKVLWSIYDAAALAVGRNPETEIEWDEPTPFIQWLEAAVQSGTLKQRFSATDFLQWFDRLGEENMVLPAALRQAVAKNSWTNSDAGLRQSYAHSVAAVSVDPGAKKQPLVTTKTFHNMQVLLTHLLLKEGIVTFREGGPPFVKRHPADELGEETKEWGAGVTGRPIMEYCQAALQHSWTIWHSNMKSGSKMAALVADLKSKKRL